MTAACPACATAPAVEAARPVLDGPTHYLHLPGIHCAGCIRTVERILNAEPGVTSARVNLTQKRAAVSAPADADPAPWIEALARAGYEAHEAGEAEAPAGSDLVLHLGVAGFAMMNVMLISVAVWSGAVDTTRDFLHWVSAAIALPATAFSAQPFFRNAWRALSAGRLDMDVPISLAILLACGMSLYEVIHGGHHAWFDAALSLTFFLLAGRFLDQRMRRAARSAAANLAALEPRRVSRIEGEARVSRPVSEVEIGDRLWLAAGARVPVDATLESGTVSMDRSALTGESDPVSRVRGAALQSGEVVLTGPVTVCATRVGDDTTLRRMARLVATAENAKSRYNGLAARAAAIYTPLVHIIAAAAFTGWFVATGDVRTSLNVAIATLIITCPCALGLAVPAVAVTATSHLYRRGLLVKSDTALERLAAVDTVLFDKTGTLTRRVLTPTEDMPVSARQVLRALADASDHPLSKGLSQTLSDVEPAALTALRETAGDGIEALWGDTPVRLGREDAETVLSIGEERHRLISVESPVPDAADAVESLRARGLSTSLLTGDTAANARRAADRLGIDDVHAGVTPEGKSDVVRALQAEGRKVLMVGDGLNDATALATADASIAPGSALDASRNAADIVIVSGRPSEIAGAIVTAQTARRRILQNFAIAACYNAVAVPLAVSGFATPLMAALAMSSSSLIVILNAIRMR